MPDTGVGTTGVCHRESLPLRPALGLAAVVVTALASGCGSGGEGPRPGSVPDAGVAPPVRSVARAGDVSTPVLRFRAQVLPFEYDRGESGKALPVEVTGGGVGLLDFDGDGDLDLFFPQGVPLEPGAPGPSRSDVLLENREGRFVDASARVGLTPKGYGQGVAVADYDADGDPDVYVTRYGPNTLWRNDGGRFTDVSNEAGVACPLWSLGAAFLDFDGDGDLDLFVANYLRFNPAEAPFGRDAAGRPEQAMPNGFRGQPDALYRNEGRGRFVEVAARAGIADEGRGMGVIASDFDGDGRVDVFVANDAMSNALWHNRGDGTFDDQALTLGLAVNGEGKPEANMGVARGDTDGDGLPDVVVSHFFDEHLTLWRARPVPGGGLFFEDQSREVGIVADSRPTTGWGVVLADFDHDGHLDLVAACGHLRQEPRQLYTHGNPPLLWQNDGTGRFLTAGQHAGPYFQSLHVGRGLAAGDLDNDGDLDLVVVHHHEPSVVLWNETPPRGNSLTIRLRGRGANPDAIGARVRVTAAGRTLVRSVDGGGSYLSSHDRRVHVGLGTADRVDRIEVRWPSGRVGARTDVPAGGVVEWSEGAP